MAVDITGKTIPYGGLQRFLGLTGQQGWNKTYGGTSTDVAYSMVRTGDGGYALAGYTTSFGAVSGDFWLVKTSVESGLAWVGSSANTIALYRGATDPWWNFVRVRIWQVKNTQSPPSFCFSPFWLLSWLAANGFARTGESLAKPNGNNKMMIFMIALWKGLREPAIARALILLTLLKEKSVGLWAAFPKCLATIAKS